MFVHALQGNKSSLFATTTLPPKAWGRGLRAQRGEKQREKPVRKSHGETCKNEDEVDGFSYQVISKTGRQRRGAREQGVLNFAGCKIVKAKMK